MVGSSPLKIGNRSARRPVVPLLHRWKSPRVNLATPYCHWPRIQDCRPSNSLAIGETDTLTAMSAYTRMPTEATIGTTVLLSQDWPTPGNMYYNYIVLFWPVGQWHDYCYHHGQITYGYDKEKCDSHFYSLLFDLCTEDTKLSNKLSWYNAANCVQAAQLVREAVEKFGDSAFSYVSTVVYFEGKYSSPTNPPNENVSPTIINIISGLLD
jgi:hypothetical protein